MAQHTQHNYDPFEPGHSTPEFEQYARENYSAGGKRTSRSRGARNQAPRQQAYPQATRPQPARKRTAARAGAQRTTQQPGGFGGNFGGNFAGSTGPAGASASPVKSLVGILLCVALAVLIEVFGFNFQFFSSMTYSSAGSYLVDGVTGGTEGALTITADDDHFEITGLNATVNSIHFTPTYNEPALAAKATDSKIQVVMYLIDEGNSEYYQLPTVSVDPQDLPSTYISLDPAGKCHSIYVKFTNLSTIGSITVSGIGLNEQVPLDIDPARFAFVLAVLLVLYCLRPASFLFSTVYDGRITRFGWLVAALVAVQCVAIFILVMSNTHFTGLVQTTSTENYFQYQKLAHALLEGHLYLDDVPSAALQAMTNPYDTSARISGDVEYLWDHAYYQGKYYVYFGVLPCLVFYVPWLLVTGTGFPTWLGVAICDCTFAAGCAFLLSRVVRRWFPNTSVGAFLILDIMLFVAGGGIILARTPSMYFLPEAMGLTLVTWGLGLWISGTSRGYIERGKVVAGSLLIALTLAARPQMMLAAALGLVLFWPFLRDSKGDSAARRDCLSAFGGAMVPFIVVGVAVMIYNALRFSGPLDFGANYNLTTNDMTHRGFHLDRIPFGLYAYLFQPPALGSQFPFMKQTYMDTSYQGVTIFEPMFGGYFFLYPMTLVLLAIPRARRALSAKGLMPLWVCCLVLGFALCIFDLQGAGILMRYMSDFGIYFALAAALVFLELLQVKSGEPLSKGWTTKLGAVHAGRAPAGYGAHTAADTVSVYRIALYFLFASLVVMVVANALLWEAFGMY